MIEKKMACFALGSIADKISIKLGVYLVHIDEIRQPRNVGTLERYYLKMFCFLLNLKRTKKLEAATKN